MERLTYAVLSNGMGLVTEQTPGKVECFGVAISAGSRDESHDCYGLAHFVEHTIFKGTARRRASHILKRMDSVGGELNAFTSKEETNVYSVFPSGNLSRAAELIADLISNSVFPEKELEKEREVVKEEIDSYLDSPADAIFDEFENLIFKGTPLGHNILGDAANLSRFSPEVCRNYIRRFYRPARMVAYYRGAMSAERVRAVAEHWFGSLENGPDELPQRLQASTVPHFAVKQELNTHQAHCILGLPMPSIYSPDRVAIGLLTNILGGPAMNSRLNLALREKRGLVYSVEASATLMSDIGLGTIYFGCDPSEASRCIDLVKAELQRIATTPLTERELSAAKKQYLGQLVVASDSTEQMALSAGRTALYHHRAPDHAATIARIKALTPEALMSSARLFSPDNASSLLFV